MLPTVSHWSSGRFLASAAAFFLAAPDARLALAAAAAFTKAQRAANSASSSNQPLDSSSSLSISSSYSGLRPIFFISAMLRSPGCASSLTSGTMAACSSLIRASCLSGWLTGSTSLTCACRLLRPASCASSFSALFGLASATARACSSLTASSRSPIWLTSCCFSPAVSCPASTMALSCCSSHFSFSARPSEEQVSYTSCSSSLRACPEIIFCSTASNLALAPRSSSSNRLRCAQLCVLEATIFWKVAKAQTVAR
mmetsp:Transcript_54177/g.123439  ORF Transcript_54177/g.123439 Transcript_54177/m.123439 type:complete len:255 (-) Transcript_54177:180-944(-)